MMKNDVMNNQRSHPLHFPEYVSFTVTHACNLSCRMCGQWSAGGYIRKRQKKLTCMQLSDWKRLVDEAANHKIRFILIRGGEPFLYKGIMDLVAHIHGKGIFVSIDTNGTCLENFAEELVRFSNMHITFSVDGPQSVHDEVRGMKGSFSKIKENIALLARLEKGKKKKISKSICFTISPYSYRGLGKMPDVARRMRIGSINIVPYFYIPSQTGRTYEKELRENFNTRAYSWKGFRHESSGIDFEVFLEEYRKYRAGLGNVVNFPYMDFTEEDYRIWFRDATTPVGDQACMNIEELIDVQPDGDANFCVDFPDYSIGNVLEASIGEIWIGPKARLFRDYRRRKPLAVCARCGAKYISLIKE
ncbi:radical SAM protein [bacterium]|nr:radical SAM protein [bacterium]